MRYSVAACLLIISILAGCGGGGGSPGSTAATSDSTKKLSAERAFAPTDYHTIVQQLYIAYFGRPADPTGLANFAAELNAANATSDIQALNAAYGSNPTIRSLIDSFGVSAESNALYSGDTTSFITAIYRNVLNRDPDPEGLNFWVTAVDQRGLTRANASFSIMAGALANQTAQGRIDAMLINRRAAAGTSFTATLSTPELVNAYKGNTAAAIARDMLRGVTENSDDASIQSAIAQTLPLLIQAANSPGGTPPGSLPTPVPAGISTTMACVDGPAYQCSGSSIVRTENNVALTSSGVQVLGRSTSDLAVPNLYKTGAFGLAALNSGVAEVRLAKDSSGNVSLAAVLLQGLGLSWDGKIERPPIIETFRTAQSHAYLDGNGAIAFAPLPLPSDLSYYNYAIAGHAATQANYANNAYFPRSGNPSRCGADVSPCPTVETTGIRFAVGDWRAGGNLPDMANAVRLHEDGDIHAGNDLPGPNGEARYLFGGNGIGVPFPGSKGYREILNWGLRYANLSTWLTQDTVLIEEWAALGDEHNKNRRGAVAFGDVTQPASVPAAGTATYTGLVHGWYASNPALDPAVFRGTATITVNFATRQTSIAFTNVFTYDSAGAPVPLPAQANAFTGAAGTNVANYFTGSINTGTYSGGIGGRYFGPVISSAATGPAPAEIGGVLTLTHASTGATMIGGFVASKR